MESRGSHRVPLPLMRNLILGVLAALSFSLACTGGGGGGGQPGTYSISGTVSGLAQAGVTISLAGPSTATTTTDSSGRYSFAALPNGIYTLTPSRSGGYAFIPASASVTVSGGEVSGRDLPTTGAVPIAGRRAVPRRRALSR